MSDLANAAEVAWTRATIERLKANMRLTIKGKDEVIEQALICLLASGHLLIEDLPGVGKTTLAYALAPWTALFHAFNSPVIYCPPMSLASRSMMNR